MPAEARIIAHIRWRDLDMLGHLNQSVYHELLEEARAALFWPGGDGPVEPGAAGAMAAFVLARVELDYRREVRREEGPVEVVARVADVGRSSVTIEHDFVRSDGELAATGSSVLVAFDATTRHPRELTDEERERLTPAVDAQRSTS